MTQIGNTSFSCGNGLTRKPTLIILAQRNLKSIKPTCMLLLLMFTL
uniref:Uncharacterized protein n=1 Tax=Anguilla anguilla TaxID=7936 RepID=A0A0E9W5M2_ANGAN